MTSSRLWVEACSSIDIAEAPVLQTFPVPRYYPPDSPNWGRLNPGWRPRPFARLDIKWEDGQRLATVEVDITTTRLHFGGVRNWFVCPGCRGRAKKLYTAGWEWLGHRQFQFGCRRCLALVYECQYRKAPRRQWLW